MKEIKGRAEVIEMVDAFYDKVNKDPLLSPVFNTVAAVNWPVHLPKMYDFWESLLFGTQSYKGKPFDQHLPLPLTVEHFNRWLALFTETLEEHFEGEKAEEARVKASNIANVFRFKMGMMGALKPEIQEKIYRKIRKKTVLSFLRLLPSSLPKSSHAVYEISTEWLGMLFSFLSKDMERSLLSFLLCMWCTGLS